MLAFKQQRNIANDLALEILLYLSGQRQIKIALEEFGLKEGDIAVMILGNSADSMKKALNQCTLLFQGEASDEVLALKDKGKLKKICTFFQIGSKEIAAIKKDETLEAYRQAIFKLVLNRVALVTLSK